MHHPVWMNDIIGSAFKDTRWVLNASSCVKAGQLDIARSFDD